MEFLAVSVFRRDIVSGYWEELAREHPAPHGSVRVGGEAIFTISVGFDCVGADFTGTKVDGN